MISVTKQLSSPSTLKATKIRKKKASPMNNNNPKNNGLTDSDNNPSIQVSTVHQVTSSPPLEGVPPVQVRPLTVRLSKVRTQQISGLSKAGVEATDYDDSPVIDDNSTLT